MKIGPKYKIARRLGGSVFEKTRTAKFALRTEQKAQAKRGGTKRSGASSNYGKQLIEKQKVRYTYGLTEKQFSKYVKKVIEKNATNSVELLFSYLEKRLDNIVLKASFAPTRFASRQLVSHGHITVNGKKVTIPSYEVKEGDLVSIREGSKEKNVFIDLDNRMSETTFPSWLLINQEKREIKVKGDPVFVSNENNFDLEQVLQYYKR